MKWPQMIIGMLLLAFSTTSVAKNAPSQPNLQTSENTPPITGKKVAKIPPPNKTNKLQKDSNEADTYQASEEISEDLSVSYPVDI